MNLLSAIRKGVEPPIWGVNPGNTGARIPYVWQPGSAHDYQGEAGDLWLNGVVAMGLRFKACAISECRPTIDQWSEQDGKFLEAKRSKAVIEALRAFTEPTDDYDWTTLLGSVQLSDDVNGNSYLIKQTDKAGRTIGFRYEPHFLLEAVSNDIKRLVTSYLYGPPNGTRTPVDPENLVHIRQAMLNPRERRLGFTPLAAALRDVCADNELSTWLASILRNGAMPAHMLIPKSDGTKTTMEAWSAQKGSIGELFKKFVRDARGQTMTAPLPIEVVKLMWSPAELEIAALQLGPSGRILSGMGLDPMVVGLPSPNKTYSNFEEAVDAAGKFTILPALRRWTGQISRQSLRDFGLDPAVYRFRLDTKEVSWLQEEEDSLHKRWREAFKIGGIDRWTFKLRVGEVPEEADKGVYATDFKPPKIALGDPAGEEPTTPDENETDNRGNHPAVTRTATPT